ncbi:hypothetical protein CQW23_11228 [Capsicum baccatum]|uniref:Peptidase S9A N-terminal domain-containing protein n=1 Tax=Capsicum baccatum TaxID=33114 RepID=A0A2G2X214_CAPBA|nr:hypothetical protein CQW23_11228 [Capsicum baccatum]
MEDKTIETAASSVNNTSSLASSLMTRIVSNAKFAVEIFDGSGHFGMWQGEVLDVLFQQGLDIAIEEKKPDGIGEDDWKVINRVACGTIRSYLAREQKYPYTKETSANKLWNALEDKFLKKNSQNKLYMKKRLLRFTYVPGTTMNDHITSFNKLATDLQNMDVTFSDGDMALMLLSSLPDEYEHLETTLLHGNDEISLKEVCSALYSYEQRKREKQKVNDGEALFVRGRSQNNMRTKKGRSKLEDPDSKETKEFVEKQVILTDSVLKTCEIRDKLRERLTKLFDFPKYNVPFRAGDKYFYFHNTGLQPQKVLYVQDSLDGKPEVLLDPNTLSEDGTIALSMCAVSKDAKYLAYGISSSGSDWVTVKVMRVEDKRDEPDTISWVKFSNISWTCDSKGFFYSRYPAPKNGEKLDAGRETNANLHQEVYYHSLGTDQSDDVLCWKDSENPMHRHIASVTEDGQYVLLYVFRNCDTVNQLYYCDLSALRNGVASYKGRGDALPFSKLVEYFDASYDYVAHNGTVFTLLTNKDAPKYKLVRVDLENPDFWFDIIREDEKDVLQSAVAVNENQLVVNYLRDVKNVLQLRDLESGALLHHLPIDIGSVTGISARRKDDSVFIGFMNFCHDPSQDPSRDEHPEP